MKTTKQALKINAKHTYVTRPYKLIQVNVKKEKNGLYGYEYASNIRTIKKAAELALFDSPLGKELSAYNSSVQRCIDLTEQERRNIDKLVYEIYEVLHEASRRYIVNKNRESK